MMRRLVATLAKRQVHRIEHAMTSAGAGLGAGLQAPAPDLAPGGRGTPAHRRREVTASGGVAHLLGPNVAGRHIVILAPDGSALRRHAAWLGGVLESGVTTACPADVRAMLDHGEANKAILIADLAVFPHVSTAVSWLQTLRCDHSETVVMVGFEECPRHDMTCERFLIADASVKLPVSRTALALAVSAAMTNHAFTLPLRRN